MLRALSWMQAVIASVSITSIASFFLPLAEAQAQPIDGGAPSQPCTAPEHRQFDFWLGDWDVVSSKDEPLGRNRIEKVLGGCVLHERWTGKTGLTGESFNIYDPAAARWHQTWVDSSGSLLLLDGGLSQGRMVLTGEGSRGTVRNRITWEPLGPDKVRQLWETSRDAGKTWSTVFDGTYRRRKR